MSDALDARVEAGIAILAVLVFIGILVAAVSMGASGLGATSAYAVIAGIVVFILLMAGIGYWLSGKQGE
jgi:hypothetical protein